MQKKLYRSLTDRRIAGVAGGLANYLGHDVVLIRALFLLGFVVGTTGFWLYLILWVITPEEPQLFY